MKLGLYGKRILIFCDEISERKVGSLIISDKRAERSRVATILAVGGDVKNYQVGDRVLLSWYTGVHLHVFGDTLFGETVDEDRHRLVNEDELLGKILPD
jgi:co-chaperonin GroES (HSP10)